MILNLEKHVEELLAEASIKVFPGKSIYLIFVVSLLGNILAKATFILDHLLWYSFHLVVFSICAKDWGFTCVIFRI